MEEIQVTVHANTTLSSPPPNGTPADRIQYLAVLWARQTGRSVVITVDPQGPAIG
jgi:hypothetical protein